MPYHFQVSMLDGSVYNVANLLGKGETNTKTAKSDKAGEGYLTYSLSLAPASISGFNVCSSSSHGCETACLFTSGLANVFPRIQPARIAKTRFYKLHKQEFTNRLTIEIERAERRANKLGLKLAVRLNVLSDIMWEREVPSLFNDFPNVQFYDYTKHVNRMIRFTDGKLPTNYDLTFSRSEANESQAIDILRRGGNVAIPFRVRRSGNLPLSYKGFKIVDADKTDLRFLDEKGGVIAGLRVKGCEGKKDNSGFIVEVQ